MACDKKSQTVRSTNIDVRITLCYKPNTMADYIYVDNSNVHIEGQRVSAIAKGMAANIFEAMNLDIIDHAYRVDFGRLHWFLVGNDPIDMKRVVLFGSRPPPDDTLWAYAKQAGFEVRLENRNVAGKEKKIDTGLATLITKDAYKSGVPTADRFFIVAGDSDYVPTVKELTEDGYKVFVVFWNHAAKELKDVATKFIALDEYLDRLRL